MLTSVTLPYRVDIVNLDRVHNGFARHPKSLEDDQERLVERNKTKSGIYTRMGTSKTGLFKACFCLLFDNNFYL